MRDYCGAGARLDPERGLALDARRWAWQPKLDGVYARVELNAQGFVSRVTSRSGAILHEAGDLLGIHAGPANTVLHGELEAHTEAGTRAAAERGWRALHLFDVTKLDGRDVAGTPYTDRYGLLHSVQAAIELAGRDRWWTTDARGDAHDEHGRYARPIPRDIRRLPVVPLARGAAAAEALWRDHVERGEGEGLVAVRLDARAGARGSKRKLKPTETLDCVVVASDARATRVAHGGEIFVVSSVGRTLVPGQCVEVWCDGRYRSGLPRFARIVRERADLVPAFN